jgi:hypothetical protein
MDYVNGIALADGETVIRKYEASVLKKPRAKGYLIATNRRLLFSGEANGISGKSIISREVKIDQVTGIESYFGKGWSLGKLIFGIILTILFLSLMNSTSLAILGLAWPGYIFYKMVKNPGNQMSLNIIASSQSPSAVGVAVEQGTGLLGNLFSSLGLGGSHAWMSVAASGPGRHTEVMIRELGALIQDIQTKGDLALEKWGAVGLKENKLDEKVASVKEQIAATKDQIVSSVEKFKAEKQSESQKANSHSPEGVKKKESDEEIFG